MPDIHQIPDRIAFLGGGHLPQTIIEGLFAEKPDLTVTVYDIDPAKREYWRAHGAVAAQSALQAVQSADIVFLCLLPKHMGTALKNLREAADAAHADITSGKLYISTAAGVTTDFMYSALGGNAAVVRTMPNTAFAARRSVTAVCRSSAVSDADYADVRALLGRFGMVLDLPESQMNAVIAVNGSSPAYVYFFIAAMLQGAEQLGFDRAAMLPAICEVISGALDMLKQSEKQPEELMRKVMAPGGTTIAAMQVLLDANTAQQFVAAMQACTNRADELSAEYSK